MNSKLIVVGAISAAVGAAVSWAVTADHYENRLNETVDDIVKEVDAFKSNLEAQVTELRENATSTKVESVARNTLTDEIVLGDVSEADVVLERMRALIEAHGAASRADLFELVGLTTHYNDTRYGWTDLSKASLRVSQIGAKIDFPPIEDLNPVAETEAVIVAPIEEVADEGPTDEEFVPQETVEETREQLRNIIDQYTGGADVDEFVNVTAKVEHTEKNAQPEVISQEEFAWSEHYDDYDKVTLTYYPANRLLLDEDEEVVAEVAYVIGWRNLSQFGSGSGDADTVFVRNHKMRTDFEINRETDEQPPLHATMGMSKEEYNINKAAGLIKPPRFRPEDL